MGRHVSGKFKLPSEVQSVVNGKTQVYPLTYQSTRYTNNKVGDCPNFDPAIL